MDIFYQSSTKQTSYYPVLIYKAIFAPITACFEGMQEVNVTDDGYVASSACSKDTGDPDIRKEHTPHNGRLNNQLNAG